MYFWFGSSAAVQKSEKTLNVAPIFERIREDGQYTKHGSNVLDLC